MKKTIITSIVLTLLATGVLLFSCKKQEPIQPQNPVTDAVVSFNNKLLVFGTTDAYRKLVDKASAQEKLQFTNKVKAMNNFTSYSEYVTSKNPSVLSVTDSIESDFMRTILNADEAVQIGDYIYKIDIAHEKVFALAATHANEYPDVISGNTANPHVRAFSIGDDVLSLSGNTVLGKGEGVQYVEPDNPDDGGGGSGGSSGPCNDCTVGTNKEDHLVADYKFTLGNTDQERVIYCKIKYERYGIYFTLYSRMDPNVSGSSNDQTQYLLDMYVYYHARNGVTNGPYTKTDYTNGNTIAALKYQSYDGSKPIAWMHFESRYKIKVTDPTVTTTFPPTDWLVFNFNM